MDVLGKYSVQNLQKFCKIVCRCSIVFMYKNLLQNVDINFLLITLDRIIFYAIFVKTVMHVNGICYTSDDCLF